MKYVIRALLYLVLVAPLALFIVYSFTEGWFFPAPFPSEWTTTTFQRAMDDPRTLDGMWQGFVIAVIVSLLSLILAFPAARALGLRQFRGRQIAWLVLFLPTVVPPLAIGMGLNILFLRVGLAGTIMGVSLAHLISTLPYTVFTLSSAFARYDENYEHQALALGASPAQIFFNITLRMMTPSLVVATLFAFLVSWSQYLLTLLIGGGKIITLPVLLFTAASGGNPSTIAIKSLLFILPPALVIAFTARELNRHGNDIREQY
ncbi:MAG: ABC transporter permease [Chloroflexi bacterium]|nr:ABC transporter permease [Chloroflexota bacterium]